MEVICIDDKDFKDIAALFPAPICGNDYKVISVETWWVRNQFRTMYELKELPPIRKDDDIIYRFLWSAKYFATTSVIDEKEMQRDHSKILS
jgi:hypothetical protein